MRRSQSWQSTALLLLLLTFVSFACKKNNPAPPPPPPPAPAATTPPAPPQPVIPAPTVTLTANAQTITRGGTVTLTWTTTNATTVDIQPEIGAVTPAATGTRQVSPTSSVTYAATVTGPGGTRQDTVRITVNDPPPPPPARGRAPAAPLPPPAPPTFTTQQLIDRNMLPINFDYDKSDIRDDQKSKLQAEATFLKANINVRLVVEGHADERGSEEYNLALGDRRANAVKEYFVAQGIAEKRLFTVSYGEERPVCSTQTEECYAMNRRTAFRINP